MRILLFVFSTLITIALIFALDRKWGSVPPMGRFLSPQSGFWQNAESEDFDFNDRLQFNHLKGKVSVYFDERLVPHVFAQYDNDAYFVQGWLHARFRLWQMEFQSLAAAGRIAEVLGNDPLFVNHDRRQRRLGMVYAAENALKEVSKDTTTQKVYDAYTAGVNAYIGSLTKSSLPLEYKLLSYEPEQWTNLKSALFTKLMSSDLAGTEYARDMEFSNARSVFSLAEMNILFPEVADSLKPIIPSGTPFEPQTIYPIAPAGSDSVYFGIDSTASPVTTADPTGIKGSNNWAVSGSKTASGAPILCNDPHLRLSFPSVWYEMQIRTPTMNAYGVTFPSVPGIVIGYNEHIAFGVTNAGRDVIDYYRIRFRDETRTSYWYNGQWTPTEMKMERFKVRGAEEVIDTVAYTVFGPVMYDRSFAGADTTSHTALAVRWTAHDPSNEQLTWIKLNRARNYNEYRDALQHFSAPGQNMLFASKSGDIAITQQGKFPARWTGQGLYVMPGEDSSYAWQGFIPHTENPHVLNPADGFIQSANQRAVDSTYPYFIPGDYIVPRGVSAYNLLRDMQQVTVKDMMALQMNNYSSLAADAVPLLIRYTNAQTLNNKERSYLDELRKWDFHVKGDSRAATIYQSWIDSLEGLIWNDELSKMKQPQTRPDEQTMIEIFLRDSAARFIDNITTPQVETLDQQVTVAFRKAAAALAQEDGQNGLLWWKHRNTTIMHLLRGSVMPFARGGIEAGGWGNTLCALTATNGPSWRMIVHLTPETEAYGVYPGGQSGNPGSRYYDSFVDTWSVGKYYTLWMMKDNEQRDERIKWTMHFSNQ